MSSQPEPRSTASPRPLRTPRVAEAVAAQLRKRIIEGDLGDGSELPTEAVLLTEFPASRPSLREAFRILETEGLLSVRRGKRGGTVITSPTADTAAYHMGLLLHSRSTPMTDLAEARNLIEPLCAEQAARRPDHAAIGAHLVELNAQSADVIEQDTAFTDAATEWHQGLVDASGNQTLRTIAGMMESVWSVQERGWAREASADQNYPSVELLKTVVDSHEAIARAIQSGDAERAGRLTASHLGASQLYVASESSPAVRVLDEYGSPRMTFGR